MHITLFEKALTENKKNKKGMESLISWVLLVGLTVALAAIVTNWAIGNIGKFNPEEIVNDDLYCGDLSININSTCHIKNNGLFGVSKIIVQYNNGGTNKIELQPRLLPGEAKKMDIDYGINCDAGNGYIPVTKNEDGVDVVCSEKKVEI